MKLFNEVLDWVLISSLIFTVYISITLKKDKDLLIKSSNELMVLTKKSDSISTVAIDLAKYYKSELEKCNKNR